MKRLTKTLAALVAASAVLAACQTAPVETVEANHLIKTVEFTAEDVETRTAFTEPDGVSYPVRWTANDTDVAIFPDDYARLQKAVVEPSADGRTAKFHASFALEESSSYRFYLVSPASALDEYEPEMGSTVTLTVPTDQYPTALSPDEAAQILYARSDTFTSVPDAVTFNPYHLTSYIKLSLTNVAASVGNVGYVRLTSTELIAGKAYLSMNPFTLSRTPETGSNTVTAYVDNLTDIWFGILPTQVAGTKLTVTVSGSKGAVEREVTLPEKQFASGRVATFTVDMSTATPAGDQVFGRIDEARFVTEGAQFVIATAADNLSWAVGTTQGADFRPGVVVTKTNPGTKAELTLESIVNPSDDVEVLTVEAGTATGTYAFKTKAGKYLAIDKDKNAALVSIDTKSTLSDWRIRYSDGECEFRNNSTSYTYYLRYRKSDNKFVAMRSSFASGGEPIALYKLEGSGGSDWKLPPELRLTKQSLTLTRGETRLLGVGLCYSLDDGGVVTFRSDDPTVATVDDKGNVTAVKDGETLVWAHVNETENYQEDSVSCKITVLPPVPIESISISPDHISVFEGETKKLSLIVNPSNAYCKEVKWIVSETDYLTVDDKGNVTGIKARDYAVNVTAKVWDADGHPFTAKATVFVVEPYAINSFNLSPNALSLKVGESKPVSLVVDPSDAEILETEYSSEDETVATFKNGVVKAIGPGHTFVHASILTNDGRRWPAYCEVTVSQPVTSVEVSPSKLTLTPGSTAKLTATVIPSDADNKEITWSSSNPLCASVSSDGTVTGHKEGTTVITATSVGYNQIKGTCSVKVESTPVLKVQYSKSSLESATWTDYSTPIQVSSTNQEYFFRLFDTANGKVLKSGEFSNYHTSYPMYLSCTAEVYANYLWRLVLKADGFLEETLTCKDETLGVDFEQRVVVYYPRPLGLSLDNDRSTLFTSGSTVTVKQGSTRTLYFRHKNSDREEFLFSNKLSITGGDPSIATVTMSQVLQSSLDITAKKAGTTTYRIKYEEYGMALDNYVTIKVTGPVTKVTINQKSDATYYYDDKLNLDRGDVMQMTANVEGGDGEGVTWSLMTSADAISVNETTGRIQGVKYGAAYLKAASVENPSVYDYVYVYVWEPATEIRIGQPVRVKPGYTEKLYYVVEPSNYANQKIQFETPGYYAPQVQRWTIGSTVTESSGWRTITLTPPADEGYNAGNPNYGTSSQSATYVRTKNGKIRKEVPLAVVQYYKTDTKPMDYIVRTKNNTPSLRSMDGGLRIVQDKFGNALIDETAINISNNEEVIAVIHKINTGNYSYASSYTVVNGNLSNAPNARGVAVAINDTGSKVKWSSDKDDVPNAEDWPKGQAKYPSCLVTSVNNSQQNGVPLSACAVYYNYKRGDSHDIQPEKQITAYQESHPVYVFRFDKLTGGNDPTVPGWFVPTIAEWYDLKCYTADVHKGIINNIKRAGGDFPDSRDYWLIECYDKSYAWYASYLHGAYHDKQKSAQDCYVRPFIRF